MTVTKQNLGKVCVTPAGTYAAYIKYQPLDLVSYGNGAYMALQEVKGVEPTDTTYWQMLCCGGGGSPILKDGGIMCWPLYRL